MRPYEIAALYRKAEEIPPLIIPPFERGGKTWEIEPVPWLPWGLTEAQGIPRRRPYLAELAIFIALIIVPNCFSCDAHPAADNPKRTVEAGVHSIYCQLAITALDVDCARFLDELIAAKADVARLSIIALIDDEIAKGCALV